MATTQQVGALPAESTSFVGRQAERAAARRLLSKSRIVTMVGPGGVGKTRLALRAAVDAGKSYPDGVWFIKLADVKEAHTLSHTVAQALGIRDLSGRDTVSVIIDYLSQKQCLLVMDNCEQITDECVRLFHTLIHSLPRVQILATSRQALCMPEESILEVLPFPVQLSERPGYDHQEPDLDAVTLFEQRAAAATTNFAITTENQQTVQAICHRLEGIPLAIELAAVRLRSLSPEQLLSRLNDRFALLSSNGRDMPDRHRTLRAAIDWSYGLCTEEERTLWARLSVFTGGFDLDAVESVCSDDQLDGSVILGVLSGLIEKSIVRRIFPPAGLSETRARYHLLETLSEYGEAQLTPDEHFRLHRRHLDCYARLAKEDAKQWFGPRQHEWHRIALSDRANLRAALTFCLNEPDLVQVGLKMAGNLWCYWAPGGFMAEGRQWLERLLELDERETKARGEALWVCSWIASHQGDSDSAVKYAEAARRIAEHLRDTRIETYAMQAHAVADLSRGDADEAIPRCQEAWNRHRTHGEFTSPAAMALVQLSLLHCSKGNIEEAAAKSRECLGITREHGESWTHSWALVSLGLTLFLGADLKKSMEKLLAAVAIKAKFGDLFGLAMAIEFLSWVCSAEGKHQEAAKLFGALESLWAFTGVTLMGSPKLLKIREQCRAETEHVLGPQGFTAIILESHKMRIEETVAYVLTYKGDETPAKASIGTHQTAFASSPLTRREQEVAKLIAQGLSNKEIATKLVISSRTAETHVGHIMAKLDCPSRTAVVAWLLKSSNGDAHDLESLRWLAHRDPS
ncbi:LuxR C-terminal-related transcriptional regulator [Streptomyces nigra]|uniref:LuxR C-terminal-related transcriptional regulator n=1 Tax=Streptomyces nigra TaxID=1827580 RepID=UPI00365C3359